MQKIEFDVAKFGFVLESSNIKEDRLVERWIMELDPKFVVKLFRFDNSFCMDFVNPIGENVTPIFDRYKCNTQEELDFLVLKGYNGAIEHLLAPKKHLAQNAL